MRWLFRAASALLFVIAVFLAMPLGAQRLRVPLFPSDPAALGLSCRPDTVEGSVVCRRSRELVLEDALTFEFPRSMRRGGSADIRVAAAGRKVVMRLEGDGFSADPAEQTVQGRAAFRVTAHSPGRLLARLVDDWYTRAAYGPVDRGDVVRLERYPIEILEVQVRSGYAWLLAALAGAVVLVAGEFWKRT